jgi:hypothetical protein
VKVLAILRPGKGVDVRAAVAAHARPEVHALWGLYREGMVREMYSPGGPGAVLIVEAATVEAAESVLASLPLLANDVMSVEMIELRPFAAFEVLFSDDDQRGLKVD